MQIACVMPSYLEESQKRTIMMGETLQNRTSTTSQDIFVFIGFAELCLSYTFFFCHLITLGDMSLNYQEQMIYETEKIEKRQITLIRKIVLIIIK